MPSKQVDHSVLRMALVGYEVERQKIEAKIREIRDYLNGVGQPSKMPPRFGSDGR
jgi:hypothetical protein